MPQANVVMNVRKISNTASIIDIEGDVSAFAEDVLMEAYSEASLPTTRSIILNFNGIRANRQKQRMLAFGLSDHYKHIFELTRLNEAIGIYETEADVLAVA